MLDLDALEREYEQQKTWSDEFQHLTDWQVVLPLIQRLREAEALNESLSEKWQATVRSYDETENRLQARIAQLEQIIDEEDVAIERLTTKVDAQQVRIAQLERVREAAENLRDAAEIHKALPLLYAALAAVEEK